MITVKQQSKLMERIKSLSELELDSFLEDLGDHLSSNNMGHLVDKHFDNDVLRDEIADLQEQLNEQEESARRNEEKLDDIQDIVDEVKEIEEFEEDSFDELISAIKKIDNTI